MDSITIVGMGTSDERQLTLEAADALLHAPRLVLRTARHGVAAYLTAQGASFESLDALYERADDFETLAEEAADYLEGMLAQGPITYGVPGQGLMEDDTVGCLVATRFDRLEELSLLIDIGTNGEMVLGDRRRRIACSTAAGPAFEGAKISCGMRGVAGAVDHVTWRDGGMSWHVIGEGPAEGLCGSGLLDLTAALLEEGVIDETGRLEGGAYRLCPGVTLTQKDVREVQLAKGAIRAGIELLAEALGADVEDIQTVYLAGAFGNYLTPASACRVGMIPPVLEGRVVPIGNAAGEGAKLCALSREEFAYSQRLAAATELLELAALPAFQDRFIGALGFSEDM